MQDKQQDIDRVMPKTTGPDHLEKGTTPGVRMVPAPAPPAKPTQAPSSAPVSTPAPAPTKGNG